jgi:hypothetical protein
MLTMGAGDEYSDETVGDVAGARPLPGECQRPSHEPERVCHSPADHERTDYQALAELDNATTTGDSAVERF